MRRRINGPRTRGEFDAVMFLSRNGTQGEAGVGLKPLSVPKFRMLLFA